MLAKRLIPCLDVDRGRVVKGVRFVSLRDAGDPVECAARYDAEGADELVFLDITASSDARPDRPRHGAPGGRRGVPALHGGRRACVRWRTRTRCCAPGADKVAVNTAAVEDPALLDRLSRRFGSQAVVLAIDARRDGAGGWEVFVHGGRTPTGRTRWPGPAKGRSAGPGEILLTSMDRDGTKDGFDLPLTRAVADAVPRARGGLGRLRHRRPTWPRCSPRAGRARRWPPRSSTSARCGSADGAQAQLRGRRSRGAAGR